MPRQPLKPTEEQRRLVKSLAAYGTRQEEIAGVVGVSAKTLRRHFRGELDRGATEANTQVAQTVRKPKSIFLNLGDYSHIDLV